MRTPTKSAYIVWNNSRSEGFVTDDYDDAWQVSTGQFNAMRSTAGEAFFEAYRCDVEETGEALDIEEIEVEAQREERAA